MERFQQLLAAARGTGWPWVDTTLGEEQVKALAGRLEPDDVVDTLDWMDHLVDEKETLPEWDGDSRDDIAKAQHELARLLAALPPRNVAGLEANLGSRREETRRWILLARTRMEP